MIACDCEVCLSTNKKDKRLRSSVWIRSEKTSLVIDTGPDFRYQMLRQKVRKLDAVLFTHPHKDHLAGLDDIRAFNFFTKKPMEVYADSLTEEALRRDSIMLFPTPVTPVFLNLTFTRLPMNPFRLAIFPSYLYRFGT